MNNKKLPKSGYIQHSASIRKLTDKQRIELFRALGLKSYAKKF